MKKAKQLIETVILTTVLLAICSLAIVATGCATAQKTLLKATQVTNSVTTNAVVVTAAPQISTVAFVDETTNAAGIVTEVTNTVQQTNTVYATNTVQVTNLVVTTNYTPNAAIAGTLSTLSTINTITGAVDPFSGWIALILGAATTGLGFYAKAKTTQAATHASTVQTVLNAVQTLAPEIQPVITAAIHAEAAKAGTSGAVYAALQAAAS